MKNSVLCYLENSAKSHGDKIAVIDEKGAMTFGEMREFALRVANSIFRMKTGTQKPVLVFLPKGKESIAVFMGIVYSRNFYVPTDTKYPKERICSLLEVLCPSLIVTDVKNQEKLLEYGVKIPTITIEDTYTQQCVYSGEELCHRGLLSDLVYTIFTSGSTGAPKGVTISNLNILEYIDWATEALRHDENTVMGNLAPLYFDLSTHEIYTCLAKAATLVITPEKYVAFPGAILKYIKEKHVNTLYWVPSAYVNVATLRLLESIKLDEITSIIFGGEVMPVKVLNYWIKNLPNLKLKANMYGPTEATVNCTYYIIDREFKDDEFLPLGKACDIKELMLLDEKDNLIEQNQVHISGELCVCGTSLSRGYWNNPEMTAKAFVPNPFCNVCPNIMYRTGDMASYNEYGEFVYVGRKDFQIKHMGYRIELGEIEAGVLKIKAVDNACVLYDNKKKKIVLVYCGSEKYEEAVFMKMLGQVLPKYMVPSVYVYLESLPVTDSGKIDRKCLAAMYTGSQREAVS